MQPGGGGGGGGTVPPVTHPSEGATFSPTVASGEPLARAVAGAAISAAIMAAIAMPDSFVMALPVLALRALVERHPAVVAHRHHPAVEVEHRLAVAIRDTTTDTTMCPGNRTVARNLGPWSTGSSEDRTC